MSENEKKKTHTFTLEIPERIHDLLQAASTSFDVTHGTQLVGAPLLVALIERGARAVLNARGDRVERKIGDMTAAELADVLGIADVEAAREMGRQSREKAEQNAQAVTQLFADVQALRQVDMRRIKSAKDMTELAERIAHAFGHHPGLEVVLAVAFAEPTADGATRYSPAVPPETIN